MSKERSADRSGVLKCAIFMALFLVTLIISRLLDVNAFKLPRYVVLFIIGVILFKDDFLKGLKDWKAHPLKNSIWLVCGFLSIYIAQIIGAIPESIFYPDYGGMNTDSVIDAMRVLSPLIYIPIMGICGPILEEIIFRLILVDKLRGKIPGVILVIMSGLLFTIYHMHAVSAPEFLSCLPHGMTGAVYAIVMLKNKNITTTCGMHILFNTLCLITYSISL
ncbi:MAG: CPBP family intramembrane metalloprotease [Clostridiales bacterium]|nr:CPBP family intramembrane metalloprotease [Clostridiales bacterium]